MELSNLKNSLTYLVGTFLNLMNSGLELANNPLVKRVIAVLDKNRDGEISFLEFV